MKKQILVIAYALISIVFGYLLSISYNTFEFLIPIIITTLLAGYFLCDFSQPFDWKGIGIYLSSSALTYIILLNVCSPDMNEARLLCMNSLSVMFAILGSLAGGILRYELYRMEQKGNNESNITQIQNQGGEE